MINLNKDGSMKWLWRLATTYGGMWETETVGLCKLMRAACMGLVLVLFVSTIAGVLLGDVVAWIAAMISTQTLISPNIIAFIVVLLTCVVGALVLFACVVDHRQQLHVPRFVTRAADTPFARILWEWCKTVHTKMCPIVRVTSNEDISFQERASQMDTTTSDLPMIISRAGQAVADGMSYGEFLRTCTGEELDAVTEADESQDEDWRESAIYTWYELLYFRLATISKEIPSPSNMTQCMYIFAHHVILVRHARILGIDLPYHELSIAQSRPDLLTMLHDEAERRINEIATPTE